MIATLTKQEQSNEVGDKYNDSPAAIGVRVMTIKDERLLREFREKRGCEWCGRSGGICVDPHHLWARGLGSGSRLDVRPNLIALCRLQCHHDAHNGTLMRCDLLAIVALREKVLQDHIQTVIHWLFRRPKETTMETAPFGELDGGSRRLAKKTLAEVFERREHAVRSVR